MLGGDIKQKVVVKLEEFSPYMPDDSSEAGPLVSGNDSLSEVKPIYSYIDETLKQAADEILKVAPLERLNSELACSCCVKPDGCIGIICLPDDFLRLSALRMNTWTRTVRETVPFASLKAYQQDYEWTRGTPQKPVVVLEEGRLHYYSVKAGEQHTVREFRYIPEFSEYDEYSDDVAELIALNCAKKIYEIFQNIEGVKMMSDEIKSSLEALAL